MELAENGLMDTDDDSAAQPGLPALTTFSALAAATASAACGGGSGAVAGADATGTASTVAPSAVVLTAAGTEPARPAPEARPSSQDAARFLTQASFGAKSVDEIEALRAEGLPHWLWSQFSAPTTLQTSYLDSQKSREKEGKATEEMSYEAIWQQWLGGTDQLRARMSFALGQIVVISNIAPDIKPYAMSSYMDLLNRNAFGNYRTLLGEVALHPAMGYYLNMIESEKDVGQGHPP